MQNDGELGKGERNGKQKYKEKEKQRQTSREKENQGEICSIRCFIPWLWWLGLAQAEPAASQGLKLCPCRRHCHPKRCWSHGSSTLVPKVEFPRKEKSVQSPPHRVHRWCIPWRNLDSLAAEKVGLGRVGKISGFKTRNLGERNKKQRVELTGAGCSAI